MDARPLSSSPPPSPRCPQSSTCVSTENPSNPSAVDPNPTADSSSSPAKRVRNEKRKRKRVYKDAASSSSRVAFRRRSMRVVRFCMVRRSEGGFVEAIGLPLGMSFAAVVAQVLEKKDAAGDMMSIDHLSRICTSAFRESLTNVFGDNLDYFARNFEKSFGSTLRTLRLFDESSTNMGRNYSNSQGLSTSDVTSNEALEKKDAAGDMMSIDHLSRIVSKVLTNLATHFKICTSVVRESLTNIVSKVLTNLATHFKICTSVVRESLTNMFGDKFDYFARNFKKSFGSMLRTLRLLNESFTNKGRYHSNSEGLSTSDATSNEVGCTSPCDVNYCHSVADLPTIETRDLSSAAEEVQEQMSTSFKSKELALDGENSQLILEKKDAAGDTISIDHLSRIIATVLTNLLTHFKICTLVVRESLTNVFGDKFDYFAWNFKRSFGSSLRTLRLINELSTNKGRYQSNSQGQSTSDVTSNEVGCTSPCGVNYCHSEADLPTIETRHLSSAAEEAQEQISTSFISKELALDGENSQLVLKEKDASGDTMTIDHLSRICTSAVREPLTNVFGDKFNYFARNFEKSFGSTLSLRLINESSINKGRYHTNSQGLSTSDVTSNEVCCTRTCSGNYCYSEANLPAIETRDLSSATEEVQEQISTGFMNKQLVQDGENSQLVFAALNRLGSLINQNMLTTMEKSVVEQVRSNDLKTLELDIAMENLKLRKAKLALNLDSNNLERSKLAMGISKASFKSEKFKNQVEDTRHAELVRNCIDCLVTGIVIMSASLSYAAYVYSYRKISEATEACTPSALEAKSWWIPKSVSSVNSGLNTLKCQVQVMSRMIFGFLMILVIAYLLLQRASTSRSTMPITFILLLLGVVCGFAGKLCVEALGGSGYMWLLYWETLCLLHFFSINCKSLVYLFLHGPVNVTPGWKRNTIIPYWVRRSFFYATLLLFLPLGCGIMPFASLGEWKEHFSLLLLDYQSAIYG